ncbi:MATE family efflux transporter [bacterium]|nr:MATE family efflux transporter [bacterium]
MKKHYIKDLLQIAFPIIIGNIGFILIGAGDVLIAGRHSTQTLAAISIATAITNCIQIFGIGLLVAVSPLLSNYRGEKKSPEKYFFPTLRFAAVLGVVVMSVILALIPLIDKLNYEHNLAVMVKQYMFVTAFATFGGYLHAATKEFLQAFEIVIFPNIVTIFAVFLNLFLNVVLVFGFGFIPSLGIIGLAIASFVVRYFMGIVLLIYCFKIMKFENCKDFGYYKQLIKIGLPISLAIVTEFVAFNIIAVLMGRVAGVYAAAQNLIQTMTTFSFMIPLAISNAIAVKVGYANGAKDYEDLKNYSQKGTLVCIGFMVFSSVIFALFPKFLVGLFTNDTELITICVPVIYLLAGFQVFDGLQVALSGICKGIKSTKIVLIANFTAYWLLSIPLGCILAFKFNMELMGFWISLIVAAIILCSIMLYMLKRYFKKLQTESV